MNETSAPPRPPRANPPSWADGKRTWHLRLDDKAQLRVKVRLERLNRRADVALKEIKCVDDVLARLKEEQLSYELTAYPDLAADGAAT